MTTQVPEKSSSIDAVLFDLDETLIVHRTTMLDICRDLFREFSEEMGCGDETAFLDTLLAKANDLWLMMFDGVIGGDVALPYTFINTLRALDGNEAAAPKLLERFRDHLVTVTDMAEGAAELLETTRSSGRAAGIVTNGYSMIQAPKIRHHALDRRVDFVLISEEVGYHKPDPRIFEEALRRSGVEPGRTLFVGDNLKTDIAGAEKVGMVTALIDRENRLMDVPQPGDSPGRPDFVVTHLREVTEIIVSSPLVG